MSAWEPSKGIVWFAAGSYGWKNFADPISDRNVEANPKSVEEFALRGGQS